jgi:polysaccharide biosynthesis protein PelC
MIIISNNLINKVKSSFSKKLRYLYFISLSMLFTGCTTMNLNVSNGIGLPAQTPIVIGPLANHSDTPLANRQVESMIVGILQTHGFRNILPYPRPQSCEKLLYCPDEAVTHARLAQWARQHKAAFILTGSANEWRYKVGLDGEPVVGVTLVLINANTGKTVWTSVGSAIGGSRSGLDVIGQRLLTALLKNFSAVG